jgi:hypothetical protein
VELEEVVRGRNEPPFGSDGRASSSSEPVDAAVELRLTEDGLDHRLALALKLAAALAREDAAHERVIAACPATIRSSASLRWCRGSVARFSASHVALAMSVRPAWLGLLVPTNVEGVAWMTMFDAALAAHARFWGASGNLIFPLTAAWANRRCSWLWLIGSMRTPSSRRRRTRAEMREACAGVRDGVLSSLRDRVRARSTSSRTRLTTSSRGRSGTSRLQPTADQLDMLNARLVPFHHDRDANCLHHFNAMQQGRSRTRSTSFNFRARSAIRPRRAAARGSSQSSYCPWRSTTRRGPCAPRTARPGGRAAPLALRSAGDRGGSRRFAWASPRGTLPGATTRPPCASTRPSTSRRSP